MLENKDLIEILESKTTEDGSFTLRYNSHKEYYSRDIEKVKSEYLSIEELEDNGFSDVDFEKDIYCLSWYNCNSVGFYKIISNSFQGLKNELLELIKVEKL